VLRSERYGEAADVWGAGCILMEALTLSLLWQVRLHASSYRECSEHRNIMNIISCFQIREHQLMRTVSVPHRPTPRDSCTYGAERRSRKELVWMARHGPGRTPPRGIRGDTLRGVGGGRANDAQHPLRVSAAFPSRPSCRRGLFPGATRNSPATGATRRNKVLGVTRCNRCNTGQRVQQGAAGAPGAARLVLKYPAAGRERRCAARAGHMQRRHVRCALPWNPSRFVYIYIYKYINNTI
jgi:hypothetical protein